MTTSRHDMAHGRQGGRVVDFAAGAEPARCTRCDRYLLAVDVPAGRCARCPAPVPADIPRAAPPVTVRLGDATDLPANMVADAGELCFIVDPPFDDPKPLEWAAAFHHEQAPASTLVFTSPAHVGTVTTLFGAPAWLFVWDTASPWQTGGRRPLQQSKLCLWFGNLDDYDRDAVLHGTPPPARDHPTTTSTPLDGRRLVDVHRASLRWLHHPGAGRSAGTVTDDGTERFSHRQGHPALRHAKPLEWVRCLIGNTMAHVPAPAVFDPFAGSGTMLVAAKQLGYAATGIDVDPAAVAYIMERLAAVELGIGNSPAGAEPTLFDMT